MESVLASLSQLSQDLVDAYRGSGDASTDGSLETPPGSRSLGEITTRVEPARSAQEAQSEESAGLFLSPDVEQLLIRLELTQYREVFAQQEIDMDVLLELSDVDLRDLGMLLGPRRKLLRALAESGLTPGTSAPVDDRVASPPTSQGMVSERRTVTLLACTFDAEFDDSQDVEHSSARIRALHEICRHFALASKSYLLPGASDVGVLAFGFPIAHEDDAIRAIRTAIRLTSAQLDEAIRGASSADGIRFGAEVRDELQAASRVCGPLRAAISRGEVVVSFRADRPSESGALSIVGPSIALVEGYAKRATIGQILIDASLTRVASGKISAR